MKTKIMFLLTTLMMLFNISTSAQSSTTPIRGDLNNDGVVDASDIVELVKIIMSSDERTSGSTMQPSSKPSIVISGLDGKTYKLLSINTSRGSLYEFNYDNNGILTKMKNGSSSFSLSESSFVYSNNSTGNYGYTVNVILNDNGFVSNIIYEYIKNKGGGNHKENGLLSFSYNNEKQLVSINGTVTANWVDEMQREGWFNITIKHTNEWVDGKLVQMNVVKTGKHKEETETEESDYSKENTRHFTYGKIENKLCQMPYRISEKYSELLDVQGVEMLGILGLLGVGPSYFPTSDSTGYDLEFYTNNNGTISNEILINDNYGGKGKTMTYPHEYKYE